MPARVSTAVIPYLHDQGTRLLQPARKAFMNTDKEGYSFHQAVNSVEGEPFRSWRDHHDGIRGVSSICGCTTDTT